MPTINELPPAVLVDAADLLPISQTGTLRAVSSGELLASTQPAIMAPSGSLLGRISLGPGGPEAISVGVGLGLQGGVLSANGTDHASFAVETTLADSDQFVLSSSGVPKLLALPALISALTSTQGAISVASLPLVQSMAGSDLIAISQNGTNAAISLANLLDGETLDEAAPAAGATDADAFWVAQGGSTMLRQTLGALWTWLAGKFATYKVPILEVGSDTTLDGSVHNGHILICSSPVTLTPAFATMGTGFVCDVLNLSSGSVTFASGIIVSSGVSTLGPSQVARIYAVSYSQGSVVLAAVSGGSSAPLMLPGQVTGVAATNVTASGASISWSAPSSGGSVGSYLVQYNLVGSTAATTVSVLGGSASISLSGLSENSSYQVSVTASNAAGLGPASAIGTFTTPDAAPGQVSNLTASIVQPTGLTLTWLAPVGGGSVASYTVQISSNGGATWQTYSAGISTTSVSVTGLSPSTAYNFQVFAVNAAGAGPSALTATVTTPSVVQPAVSSITWNVGPAASYPIGGGPIGINVHVSPSSSAVQFGLSATSTTLPTSWVASAHVNSDLWGAYVSVPGIAGTYYLWCEGTDGSCPTVFATPITVS